MTDPRLILASGSPQRTAILDQLGVPHLVRVSGADELTSGPPEELVLENAYRKAAAVAATCNAGTRATPGWAGGAEGGDGLPVLGVDTIVAVGRQVYGKPADREEAAATLSALSGRRHRVLSGLCIITPAGVRTAAAVTDVTFRGIDDRWLAWYLDTEEWRERAGGYAIQGRGAALVTGIDGDYSGVVGLPVATLIELQPSILPGP